MNRLTRERKFFIFYVMLFVLVAAFSSAQGVKKVHNPQSYDVLSRFIPSGWMGDGEKGTRYIQFLDGCRQSPHSTPVCVKVTYIPGPTGWAGIYWQNKANNWGDKPGNNLSKKGYKKLTFWAKGEKGGEMVELKAGGIDAPGKRYKDSFEVSTGKIILEKEWKQYTLDLEAEDLSSVIGGFCWVASRSSNPGSGAITFYIDDAYYE
jgi:hypothetical protein